MMTSFSWIINEIIQKIRKNRWKIATDSKFGTVTLESAKNQSWNFWTNMTSWSCIINEISQKYQNNRRKIATDSNFDFKIWSNEANKFWNFRTNLNSFSWIINEITLERIIAFLPFNSWLDVARSFPTWTGGDNEGACCCCGCRSFIVGVGRVICCLLLYYCYSWLLVVSVVSCMNDLMVAFLGSYFASQHLTSSSLTAMAAYHHFLITLTTAHTHTS